MIVFFFREISLETTVSYFKTLSQNKLQIMGKMLETESRDSLITMPIQGYFAHTNTQYRYT